MKRILILTILLFAFVSCERKPDVVHSAAIQSGGTSANWGTRIQFGTTFINTDSIKVRKTSYRDTVLADTLYSDVLDIYDWVDGVYEIKPFFTNVSGGSDSLRLDVRLVTNYKDRESRTNTYKFGPWKHIQSSMDAATYYSIGIAEADCTWWGPASGRQYRLYDTSVSVDTTTHLVTDFLR